MPNANKQNGKPTKRTSSQVKQLNDVIIREYKEIYDETVMSTEEYIDIFNNGTQDEILEALSVFSVSRVNQDQPIVDALFGLLKNPSVQVQAIAVEYLGEIGMGYPNLVYPRIGEVAQFLSSAKPQLKIAAINALAKISTVEYRAIGDYLDKINEVRNDSHPAVREEVAFSALIVASHNPDEIASRINKFVEMLKDRSPEVRKATLQVFKELAILRPKVVAENIGALYNVATNDESSLVSNEANALIKYIDKNTKVNTFIKDNT